MKKRVLMGIKFFNSILCKPSNREVMNLYFKIFTKHIETCLIFDFLIEKSL